MTEYEEIKLYGAPEGTKTVSIAKEVIDRIDLSEALRNWAGYSPEIGSFTYLIEKCDCGKRFGIYKEEIELREQIAQEIEKGLGL